MLLLCSQYELIQLIKLSCLVTNLKRKSLKTESQSITDALAIIPGKKIRSILNDPEKTALAVNLIYVNDSQPGFGRVKQGKQFFYITHDGKKVKSKTVIARINKLVIPPAWKNVWICPMENGHLQATGIDLKKRKQYRYHSLWNELRNHTKFFRLHAFGQSLPAMRKQLEKDLALPGLPEEKVLALVVNLMQLTNIRIGNNSYEKLYGSFGMTTLKDNHVKVNGSNLKFSFRGKKGIYHQVNIQSRKLSRIVKACRDIPGKELFQYYTPEGEIRSLDSGMVNAYIKKISGGEFSAKDFRTWSGSVLALAALKEIGPSENETKLKKKINEMFDIVSENLGNTRMVCKKYYVHPGLITLYEKQSIDKHMVKSDNNYLSNEEVSLLKILSLSDL